jgi:hypothetical protein
MHAMLGEKRERRRFAGCCQCPRRAQPTTSEYLHAHAQIMRDLVTVGAAVVFCGPKDHRQARKRDMNRALTKRHIGKEKRGRWRGRGGR